AAHRRAGAEVVDDGERRALPHGRLRPESGETQLILTVAPRQLVSGEMKRAEPLHEARYKNMPRAIEGVAGEPDQFVLGEAQRSRVVELVDQLPLVDDLGEAHRGSPIDELKGHLPLRMHLPNHLEHQQLVKIRVEQSPDRGVDPKRMVIDAGCDIRGHYANLRSRLGGGKGAKRAKRPCSKELD